MASALQAEGYDVVSLPPGAQGPARGLDALVVSGQNSGMLGEWRPVPPVPVVDAAGKTADEVVSAVNETLRARGNGRSS